MAKNPNPSKLIQEALLQAIPLINHGLKTQFKGFVPSTWMSPLSL
jgi:hypothetical protein